MSSSCVSRAYGLSTRDWSELSVETSTSATGPGAGEFRVSIPSSTTDLWRRVAGPLSSVGPAPATGDPIDILASLLPGFVAMRGRAPLFEDDAFAGKSERSFPHAGQAGVFIGLYVS